MNFKGNGIKKFFEETSEKKGKSGKDRYRNK